MPGLSLENEKSGKVEAAGSRGRRRSPAQEVCCMCVSSRSLVPPPQSKPATFRHWAKYQIDTAQKCTYVNYSIL